MEMARFLSARLSSLPLCAAFLYSLSVARRLTCSYNLTVHMTVETTLWPWVLGLYQSGIAGFSKNFCTVFHKDWGVLHQFLTTMAELILLPCMHLPFSDSGGWFPILAVYCISLSYIAKHFFPFFPFLMNSIAFCVSWEMSIRLLSYFLNWVFAFLLLSLGSLYIWSSNPLWYCRAYRYILISGF